MKTAFLFPGQGSQSTGMMQKYAELPEIKSTFEEASEILKQDMWDLIQNGSAEILSQTTNTQPIMLTAGVAVYRAFLGLGGKTPDFVAGHSLGEYSALVASGVLNFEDALPLVKFRAEAMQEAVPEGVGGISAILGLDPEIVKQVCIEASEGEVLQAVNLNSPEQTVIAGNRSAVERGMKLAKEKGAKRALMLPMSVPSHCSLMQPSADKLLNYMSSIEFNLPQIPIVNNVDVAIANTTAEIKDALYRQLFNPVRWVETIQSLNQLGVTTAVECGPGKVLAGLNKRIVSEMQILAFTDEESLRSFIK